MGLRRLDVWIGGCFTPFSNFFAFSFLVDLAVKHPLYIRRANQSDDGTMERRHDDYRALHWSLYTRALSKWLLAATRCRIY